MIAAALVLGVLWVFAIPCSVALGRHIRRHQAGSR